MKKRIKILFGIVSLVLSAAVYLYPILAEKRLNQHASAILGGSYFTGISVNTITGISGKTEDENPDVSIDADGRIGSISIPDMDVTLPLFRGTTRENLTKGAAILEETSLPAEGAGTNCVIAGHRGYRGLPYFKDIERLSPGSLVYITTSGGTLTYTVTGIRIIRPSDSSALDVQEGKEIVTLLTCHPYMSHGKYRYLVFCERCDPASDLQDTTSITPVFQKHPWTELGDGVNAGQLRKDTTLEIWIFALEKVLPAILPAVAGLTLMAQITSHIKRKKENI